MVVSSTARGGAPEPCAAATAGCTSRCVPSRGRSASTHSSGWLHEHDAQVRTCGHHRLLMMMVPPADHTLTEQTRLSVLDPGLSKCQLAQSQAWEAQNSGGHVSPAAAIFVPQCHPDGHFLPVQCHNQTGYCWCSTPDGEPISSSSVFHLIPDCTGQIVF